MKGKILLIDELTPYLYFLKRVLINDGFEVRLADNLGDLTEYNTTFNPNLILMDVQMNKGLGFSILKKIKNEIGITEPVIIISEGKNISEIEKAFKYGAYDYLIKPLNIRDLKNKIEKALNKDKTNKNKYKIN